MIDTEQVEDGQNEDGETLYKSQDVIGTVMVAILKKPDIRDDVESLKETVDMLVMDTLA